MKTSGRPRTLGGMAETDSFYALPSKSLEGKPAPLADYAGKVALVVNLASQ